MQVYELDEFDDHLEAKSDEKNDIAPTSTGTTTHVVEYKVDMKQIIKKMMYHFHLVAWSFPRDTTDKKQIEMITNFFNSFGATVPCGVCQNHYKNYILKNPVEVAIADKQLFKWTVDLHNDINVKNGGSAISLDEALKNIVQSVSIQNGEEEEGGEEEGESEEEGDDDEISTVVGVVIVSLTILMLALILYFVWKRSVVNKEVQAANDHPHL